MVELLDSEILDSRFSIVGPGWVKTKIHNETLSIEDKTLDFYTETEKRLKENYFVPMVSVIDCLNWIAQQPKEVVSGRNISVAYDGWKSIEFNKILKSEECKII
jgi:hypothetical protein